MSQAKVDAYKEAKANRKETIKKEKRGRMLRTGIAAILVVALLGWVGVSLSNNIIQQQKSETVSINYDAINDYLTTLEE